jgi:hypothetical protein
MTDHTGADHQAPFFAIEEFEIRNLQDEIRVDRLCSDFLKFFYLDLVEEGRSAEEASALAYGADYFLREFVIPDRRENIFALRPGRMRQFAGNWYIVRTLEPNMVELDGILAGTLAFYRYCRKVSKVNESLLSDMEKDCADRDYYRDRIEAFWAIVDDGYLAWEKECSLKN